MVSGGTLVVVVVAMFVAGFVTGGLVYRNNAKKAEAELARYKAELIALRLKYLGGGEK